MEDLFRISLTSILDYALFVDMHQPDKMNPTMYLKWVESCDFTEDLPSCSPSYYPECGPNYHVLVQKFVSEDMKTEEWRPVGY